MSIRPSLTRIMNDAKTRLPGALEDAVKRELFNVVREFFQDSNSWQQDIPFSVAANTTTYPIEPDGPGQINRLICVKNADGRTVGASYPSMCHVRLFCAPSKVETYTATVALTVIDPVTASAGMPQCPDWVFDKYGAGILDGVLGHMMSQPAKPYSSAQLALLHLRRFRSVVSMARIEAMHENLYRGASWQFPQSFAVRRK